MSQTLVIVESPAKAKTIKKYLGPGFEVLASYGHVRDLIPKDGAVDTAHDFAMQYTLIDKNVRHVDAIKKALKSADTLLLATDPDREGEAISWHLYELLNDANLLKNKTARRVVFYEITKKAVQEAVAHPRDLSGDLINAQQARRALDYLVGFNLSPLLWKKINPGLSAGRVQSPALRLIVEREQEIEAFKPQEYWTLTAACQSSAAEKSAFSARLLTLDGQKAEQFTLTNADDATQARERILSAADGRLTVGKVDKRERRRNPAPPFTTSTLQQEAVRKLGLSASRAMRLAQELYEGVDIGSGTIGLITYMRTDAVTLSNDAITEIRAHIGDKYGAPYLPASPVQYKTKSKNAQEAHEAIRPTSVANTPEAVRAFLNKDQFRLYEMIFKRAVASQMTPAVFDQVSVDLAAGPDHTFRATGSTLKFPGFIALYREDEDDKAGDSDEDRRLPPLVEGDAVALNDVAADQHFTEPPPRFTEASLVKTLEEYGIGRPSTYASIISTLQAREYVVLEQRRFQPTDMGRVVNGFLTEYFRDIVDYEFTAKLEDDLDAVSRGERDWVPLMRAFWGPFHDRIADTAENVSRQDAAQGRELGIDPKSGKPVSVRLGRFGPFAQIGTKDDEEKPKFASLKRSQSIATITLEEALDLFQLPRKLGETPEGEPVEANIGRFGPYVKFGKSYASLSKDDDPYTIDLARALVIIETKKLAEKNRVIAEFDDGISVLNGRYGPYITDGNKNAKIPKDREPKTLTHAECVELLAAAPEKKKTTRGKAAAAKSTKATAEKKPAARKSTAKSTTTAKKAAAPAGDDAAPPKKTTRSRKTTGTPPAASE
ncbi:DNA topoisomerase I [Halothiobacillus diazotrophicus]|uniref:DNA topoisomerase 1 n=1 Tax=Halothiobacillus diazotrophicus TaxID=1860122 RepID=A0A191ZIH6_9GAMM|nr:DNA topoisomerase I [Halothiobacillus diazotrophicus]ANJ67670.1 DNA topoisomerase I [Halothiobacillus diazotrophicus]